MTFEKYPFQVHDLQTLKDSNYVSMLNMQTGSGKTATSTWAIEESGADVSLVVCPTQTMRSAWIPTVRDILGVEAKEIGNSTKAKRNALTEFELGIPGVYMVSPQLLARADSSLWRGDMLVIDEAHGCMTPNSRSQIALSGFTYSQGEKSMARRFGGRLPMSGTLLRNRFQTAWSYGRTLWFDRDGRDDPGYHNHHIWLKDRMTSQTVYTAQKNRDGSPKTATQYLTEANPGQWASEAPSMITHLKREECCEFHPNGFLPIEEPTVRHETIALIPEQKKAIKELEDHLMTYLNDNPLVVELPMTKTQRIRQMVLGVPTVTYDGDEMQVNFDVDCKSPFIDRLLELLENDMEGETCVVYTDSQKMASVVTARLNKAGINSFEYSGKTRSVRDDNVERFGHDFRVMVGVLAAAGTGLDSLQRVCSNEVWLSRDLDETNNIQGEGRLERLGQTGQIMRWIFHDDLGLSEGRFGDALTKKLSLNKSLRKVVV